VNAPLFATFFLGMFWRRTTGHGAFWGLLSGTVAAAVHHGLTLPAGAVPGVKGGYFGVLETFRSEMGQTFWTAIFAWTTCFVVSIVISMLTQPRPDSELVGLVYSLTPKPESTARTAWEKPAFLGVITLLLLLVLNIIFR
jgi:Predicted symporter